jgi:hypothetical protein
MKDDNSEQKMSLPIPLDAGFESDPGDERLIQGSRLVCINGEWTIDDVAVPPDERLIVLSTFEAVQHWENGELVEQIIKKPGVVLPDVKKLNAEIPEEEWEEGDSGPKPPWAHQYGAYLIRLRDGLLVTHMNKTAGAVVATNMIRARVLWERKRKGVPGLLPIVTLGRRIVSRTYKNWGPLFVTGNSDADWYLGPEPTPIAPVSRQLEKPVQQEPVEDITHSEPGYVEIVEDDKTPTPPHDDYQPVGEVIKAAPKASMTSPRKPASQKPQKKTASSRR